MANLMSRFQSLQLKRGAATVVAVIIGLAAIAVPVTASLYLAMRQGQAEELEHLGSMASIALRRTVEGRRQFFAAVATLKQDAALPCSERSIARMREIDISSSFLQSVGFVEGDRLMCSSLGQHGEGIVLGPHPEAVRGGVRAWLNVSFDFAPEQRFNVYERDGYAVVMHPELVLDTQFDADDTSMMVFLLEPRLMLQSRGPLRPELLGRYHGSSDAAFVDGGHFVVVKADPGLNVAALAAAPEATLQARIRATALLLFPIGLFAGGLLAAAVYFVARQRMSLAVELKAALRRDEFFLQYQPIVDLRSNRCIGAEALIRWRRSDGSMVRPDVFIPVAEESGLIRQVTRWVVEAVARDATALLQRNPHCHIGINLSSADLQSQETVGLLEELIRRTGAQPRNFLVEATERGFLKAEVARGIVRAIRALGIHVAIDDFGTGYSSLSYLESFELDHLKIDKSFVDTVGTEAATSQVVLHIIEMAKSLKLEMIAEGVERAAQAEFLRARGVQYAQGWLFGKPMAIAELEAFIGSHGPAGD